MMGGSTLPVVDAVPLAVVVGPAVVLDEESFLSELQPTTARLATASVAMPTSASRFFNVISGVHEAEVPAGNVVVDCPSERSVRCLYALPILAHSFRRSTE